MLTNILNKLENGNLNILDNDNIHYINNLVFTLLDKKEELNQKDIMNIGIILKISNILYDNTNKDLLPLEHGVYDLLLELYKKYNPYYQVGSKPIHFNATSNGLLNDTKPVRPIKRIDKDKYDNFLFKDELSNIVKLTKKDFTRPIIKRNDNVYITKRLINTKHSYPELVGTLDKCKFVLNTQAIEKGVFEDSNVKILERDFFVKHIMTDILNPNRIIHIMLELKYDGISVEAEVNSGILSARTRGDANEDIAADISPILSGYKFKHADVIPDDEIFGMKFEAIMTYIDLYKYNQLKEKKYKNCRTAISGLFASSDAYRYRDLITLVPLATSLGIDRVEEVEFMNKFYHSGELLRYAIIEGTYTEVLYQIKRFTEEAEYMRDFMPFMYDGIVISYLDEDIRQKLGRENAVNKYSIAVKFNPLNKLSTFRGYQYTVGQDGSITPIIYYDPVEFYGTIHNKSSGHSYDRFKKLNLRIGDIIPIDYVNDVMPYVGEKIDCSSNANNPNPVVEFITECPSCGNKLKESKSGKTMICNNIKCPERSIKRIVSMMQKLNLKDFSEAYLSQIAAYSLSELLNLTLDDVKFFGELTSLNFMDRMNELKTKPIYDYQIIGSLGFTNIGRRKWKIILNKFTLKEILQMSIEVLRSNLVNLKGCGPITADVIINEFDFFKNDLITICNMSNIVISKGDNSSKIIRFTGFRNQQLIEQLNSLGHDAGEGSVTNKTDILLIPYEGYTSSKTTKSSKNKDILIIPVKDFISNMEKYL